MIINQPAIQKQVFEIIKSNLTIKAINPETGSIGNRIDSDVVVTELLQLLRDNKITLIQLQVI